MHNSPGTYTLYQIRKAADEFAIPLQLALWTRKRALENAIRNWQAEYEETDCPVGLHFTLEDIRKAKIELNIISKEVIKIEQYKDKTTDEMIERARRYPVELLVEFKRGKTRAFCHDDRNPSAFHGTRTNTVQCPVCAKSFDSIAVLMQRDGLTFHEAVRKLN